MHKYSDAALWQQYKSGNREALSLIYDRYVQLLFDYGLRLRTDREEIKESIHDLFVALWQNRKHVPLPESLQFFLCRALQAALERKMQAQNSQVQPVLATVYAPSTAPKRGATTRRVAEFGLPVRASAWLSLRAMAVYKLFF